MKQLSRQINHKLILSKIYTHTLFQFIQNILNSVKEKRCCIIYSLQIFLNPNKKSSWWVLKAIVFKENNLRLFATIINFFWLLIVCKPGHVTWMLASYWSILVTWPEYWPLIGQYLIACKPGLHFSFQWQLKLRKK